MKNILKTVAVSALAIATTVGMSACGNSEKADSETGTSNSSSQSSSSEVATGDDAGVKADLEEARQVVLTTLEENGDLPQIMLASDVTKPEEKYGLLVVPFHPSDASDKITSTVKVENGKFEIVGKSADTGKEYTINQDGEISEN